MKTKNHLYMPIWCPDWSTDWLKRGWLPNKGNVIFTVLMIALTLWAQSVGAITLGAATAQTSISTIPYQGYLTDEESKPLNGLHAMTFKLYTQANGSEAIWAEQWNGENRVQIDDGLFNVHLGSLNAIRQDVITRNNSLYLGIAIDDSSEMTPRVHLGGIAKQTATYYRSHSAYKALTTADRNAILSEFSLTDVPAGDIAIYCSFIASTDAPNGIGGRVILQTDPGGFVAFMPTHIFDNRWDNYVVHGKLADFAGGDIKIQLLFSGEKGEIPVLFGAGNGDGRFGRKCTITAGL